MSNGDPVPQKILQTKKVDEKLKQINQVLSLIDYKVIKVQINRLNYLILQDLTSEVKLKQNEKIQNKRIQIQYKIIKFLLVYFIHDCKMSILQKTLLQRFQQYFQDQNEIEGVLQKLQRYGLICIVKDEEDSWVSDFGCPLALDQISFNGVITNMNWIDSLPQAKQKDLARKYKIKVKE